jgi:F-type H+-transporting ATPase subunit epsilon
LRGGEHILGGKLHLTAVTPEATVYDGPADLVVVPAHDGEVAFLPGHAPYVGLLGAGEMRFHLPDGGTRHFFLEGGVVQTAQDVVNVLAEAIAPIDSIDAAKARSDLDAALVLPTPDDDALRAKEAATASARARLRLSARGPHGAARH